MDKNMHLRGKQTAVTICMSAMLKVAAAYVDTSFMLASSCFLFEFHSWCGMEMYSAFQ